MRSTSVLANNIKVNQTTVQDTKMNFLLALKVKNYVMKIYLYLPTFY